MAGNKKKIAIERIQKLILQDVAEMVFQELRDPRLRFGSVTGVKLSEDLRHAKIYVSCLGTEADRRTFLRGLESARGRIRSVLARHLRTRVTPEIAFEYDPGVERSIRISGLIDQARAEDEARRRERGEAPAAREEE